MRAQRLDNRKQRPLGRVRSDGGTLTMELQAGNVQVRAHARDKDDAIRQAGLLLVEGGFIEPGYVRSMLGREQQANTYLGNGIAIPHGMPADRDLIRRTGISVVQLPDGVEWNPGEHVRLVVGIAARSDEHLQILANLTDVLGESEIADQLATTADPAEIIAALNRTRTTDGAPTPAIAPLPDARSIEVRLQQGLGLHARPAAFLVDVASQFAAEVQIQHNGNLANAKALASLLKLGVEGGSALRILAYGPDADAALRAIEVAIEEGLGEGTEAERVVETYAWTPVSAGKVIAGVAASPGLAIGRLHQFRRTRIVVTDTTPHDRSAEQQHLQQAIELARTQLDQIYADVKARAGQNEAAIFRAHQALLDDPDLRADVGGRIEAGHSAAWSWDQAIGARVSDLERLGNERLSARAADFHDVGQRVLRALAWTTEGEASLPDEPVIVVAEDLAPSDTARLDPRRTLGVCTAAGGPTSHTAIIARSLDIPALVGAGAGLLEQPDGTLCILDGAAGLLYLEPTEVDVASAQAAQVELQQRRDVEYQARYEPALMTDGVRIEVVANIGKPAEAANAVDAGAEGVGLVRTEFLFLERDDAPSEEEQLAAYTEMTRALNGLPLVIRTLDIGGDKAVPYLALPAEANPFLGVRGIRLCLRRQDLFVPQLRAIYRASQTGPIQIMFPMVATLEEFREARALAEGVRQEVGAAPVPIGIMVEVPSTVLMADEFAKEADFFSVGTNDLTQYVLAMDRQHPMLAQQADALHPAVLRMINRLLQAVEGTGKWVGVCGGIAGDPLGAVILVGLGVSELSMSIPSVAAVKARLRHGSHAQAKRLAQRALACSTAAEVRQLVLA
jgi:multiphosphoryl transfer protein